MGPRNSFFKTLTNLSSLSSMAHADSSSAPNNAAGAPAARAGSLQGEKEYHASHALLRMPRFRSASSQGHTGVSPRRRVATHGGVGHSTEDVVTALTAALNAENLPALPPPAAVTGGGGAFSSGEGSTASSGNNGGLHWDLSALRLDTTSLLGRRMRTRTTVTPIAPMTPTRNHNSDNRASMVSSSTSSSTSDQNEIIGGARINRTHSSSSMSQAQLRALTIPASHQYHSNGHRHSRSVDETKTPVSAASPAAEKPSQVLPLSLEDGQQQLQQHLASAIPMTNESITPVGPTLTNPVSVEAICSQLSLTNSVTPPPMDTQQHQDDSLIDSPMVTVTFEAVSYSIQEDAKPELTLDHTASTT